MPDTLIDPVRPTVIDDGALDPEPAADPAAPDPHGGAPGRPPPRGGLRIALGLAAVALLAAAALGAYLFLWRYEPTARRHIPGDAHVAVRLEAADLVLFGPVRKHLWPLVDDASSGQPLGARIKEATGLDLAGDLREVVLASTDATSWVVLAGGHIPKGRLIKGLEKVARDEAWSGWRREGDLLLGPTGAAIGQADDGTIALGTDVEVVKAALPASDEWRRLDLPERGAITFALTREVWTGAADSAGALLPRAGAVFKRVDHASGVMNLGQAPAITIRISPASGEPALALANDIQAMLRDFERLTVVLPDIIGEKAALRAAQVEAKADAVELRADWPYDGLDRACARLAETIRAARAPRSIGSAGAPPR